MSYTDAQIAQVCHEANRALQTIHVVEGDRSVPISAPWPALDEETRVSIIEGVRGVLAGLTPEESHEAWCDYKRAHGWTHGTVKNDTTKRHPCLVPYDELPVEQQRKDHLFAAVVNALAPIVVTRDELLADVEAARIRTVVATPQVKRVELAMPPYGVVYVDAQQWDGQVTHSRRGDGQTSCGQDPLNMPDIAAVPVGTPPTCPDCVAANADAERIREAFVGPREPVMVEQHRAPRVGEIVHYVSHGTPRRQDGTQAYTSECRAAVVTQVGLIRDRVGLCVLNPSGQFFNEWNDHDPGTYTAAAKDSHQGAPDDIGCHELDFAGGTWHRCP